MENDRRGDIVVVMPWLICMTTTICIDAHVIVSHAPAHSYEAAAPAAQLAGKDIYHVGGGAEAACLPPRHMPGRAASCFVPFLVESCGCMVLETLKIMSDLGDAASASERITKGVFVRWEMQLLSALLQKGSAEVSMCRRSGPGPVLSREPGIRSKLGLDVPNLPSHELVDGPVPGSPQPVHE